MKNCFKPALLGILAVASCAKFASVDVNAPSPCKQIIVEAGFPDNGLKNVISSEDPTSVFWCPRDSFSLFYQDRCAVFRSDSLKPTRKSRFKGYIEAATADIGQQSSSGDEFYGIHPHKVNNFVESGGEFLFDIDSLQRAVPCSFDPMSFPSLAHSSSLSLAFYNVCGGMAFTLKNEGIRTIVFSTGGGQHIAGRVRAQFNQNGEPEIAEFLEYADSVVLKAPGDSVFSTGVRYYISLAPAVLSDGFSVTLRKKSRQAKYSHPGAVTVQRSHFGLIENIDKDVEFVIAVDEVKLDTHRVSLDRGDSLYLHASISPEDVSDKTILWTSSDENIATVDGNGFVKAINPGKVTITASSKSSPSVKDTCGIVVVEVVNLSADGTANCYIVPAPGRYKIRADAKGVSGTDLGNVTSAVRLWQFTGVSNNLVQSPVVVIDGIELSEDGKWLKFTVPESIVEGSALVAVKDAQDIILWSWHIWVAAGYDPEATAQVYANEAGTVMSRNLGSGSDDGPNYESPGMYYQWGRKDPFPGYYGIPLRYVAGNLDWPDPVATSETTGTIAYTVAHPMTYLTNNGVDYTGDWYYTGGEMSRVDVTRWGETKTDYDPCPLGWKVPKGGSDGLWATASGSYQKITSSGIWLSNKCGMYLENIFGTEGKCWYGATGSYLSASGVISSHKIVGYYWSCSYDAFWGGGAVNLYLDRSDEIYPVYHSGGANAMAVRCVRDTDVAQE